MPTVANCESEPIRSNSSGANARAAGQLHHLLQCLHPIGIARARRAPAGLPTGRRDQASEPGKLNLYGAYSFLDMGDGVDLQGLVNLLEAARGRGAAVPD